jgi:hypothetical protein
MNSASKTSAARVRVNFGLMGIFVRHARPVSLEFFHKNLEAQMDCQAVLCHARPSGGSKR